MMAHRFLLLAIVSAACGDDAPAGMADASVMADATMGNGDAFDGSISNACDFTEAADGTNGSIGGAEATGLTFGTMLRLCGTVHTGHYDAGQQLVDADVFRFTLAADTAVVLHIYGAGVDTPDDMLVELRRDTTFVGFAIVEGDHGTLSAQLTAGTYNVAVAALHAAALGTAIDYTITIATDAPATRCPTATGGTPYAETNDGASNDGNDVVSYDSVANPESSLTASGSDAPEPTGFTIAPATQYRITGSSAAVDPGDDYEDRDTFAFTTGPSTNQMAIRLNWPSTTVDFDYRVYPMTTGDPLSIVGGLDESPAEDEFETFAVKPNTTYWLWIAAYDGATGQPAAYEATLCGEMFAP